MKRCPQCAADYYDEMLEFCLEDGAKLFVVSQTQDGAPTVTRRNAPLPFTEKTLNLPFTAVDKTLAANRSNDVPATQTNLSRLEKKLTADSKILEVAPVVFALAHNWWQWVYAANQSSPSLPSFLISGVFLMWLLLLAVGASISLLAFKRCRNNGYALISLVILSINLILFLVPKR